MSTKDVWKWLLPKFDDSTIHQIYKRSKIVYNGFRTNSIKDIKTNRKRLIVNLLTNNNYKDFVKWSKNKEPHQFEGLKLEEKEINELVQITREIQATTVISVLLFESNETKVIQLFSLLKDQYCELLDIPDGSFSWYKDEANANASENKEPNKQVKERESNEQAVSKNDDKKINKLGLKIENLNLELEKRDKQHKKALEESRERHDLVLQKLNDKNKLYNLLLKEKEEFDKKHKEEQKKWEKERDNYKEKVESLQNELNHFHAKHLRESTFQRDVKISKSNKLKDNDEKEVNNLILVIGKPSLTDQFKADHTVFEFIDGNQLHEYSFSEGYDAYWILLYELSPREQYLLKNNDTYIEIENKVEICKNFNDVMTIMKPYTNNKVRN